MAEAPKEEMSASKVLAFIGMLFTLSLGIAYFYAALVAPLNILWGIICLVIVFLIFVSLGLISFGKFKIPYTWWMLLIYGAVIVIIVMFFGVTIYPGPYFPAVLLLMAFLIELLSAKKAYKVSKMVALLGCAFGAYDCVLLMLNVTPLTAYLVVNAIFGLAIIVIFLLVIFDLVNFKIFDYSWWFVLLVGFVIFTWISTFAGGYPVAGFGGITILIAFILMLMAY
ncbi:MAG: hypothetical protein ACFFFB_23825 [Candidatus Heimdallarchaeota archaeon]